MSEQTIAIERFFPVDAQTLYDAWTQPEIMAQWFFAGNGWRARVENDLREGGRYRLSMLMPNDQVHTMHGEYLELRPHRRVQFTWTSHVADNTRVTIDLEPRDGGTLLRLTHELVPTRDGRDQHRSGWQGCLDNLANLVRASGSAR